MSECVAVISVNAANVRSAPRSDASIVAIARLNDRLPVLEVGSPDANNFPWIRVTVPANNLQGWIRGDLAQLKGECEKVGALSISVSPVTATPATSTPASTPVATTPTPSPIVLPGDCRGEVTAAQVNVRNAPNKRGMRLGTLPRGTAFVIEEISPEDEDKFNWYKLEFRGEVGWVREDVIRISGDCHDAMSHAERPATSPTQPAPTSSTPTPITPTPPTPAPVTPAPTGCVVAIGPLNVNVRAQPNTAGAVVGRADPNSTFAVKSVTDTQADGFRWIQIDFRGQNGFVRNDLATLQGNCAGFTNDDRLPSPSAVRMTQGFRPPNNPQHNGIDLGTPEGAELRVAIVATVVRAHFCTNCTRTPPNIVPRTDAERQQIFRDAAWGFGYGHHIVVSHEMKDIPASAQNKLLAMGANPQHKVFVLYAHLSEMRVQVNQKLEANTLLGKAGNTGNSTAPHLHMEVGFGVDWGRAQKVNPNILFALP